MKHLWHNAFSEIPAKNVGAIEETLATKAGLLEAATGSMPKVWADEHRELATSVAEGIELSRRAKADQLGIPVNEHFGRKLALARKGAQPVQVRSVKLTVIGPFEQDLRHLRREWNQWLEENEKQHERLRRRMQQDSDRLATDFERLYAALNTDDGLGDRDKVTVPNLASLMLHAEVDGRTLLLTGDGHSTDILKGLKQVQLLEPDGSIHVDVLKVQHHGSEHNLDPDFTKLVTADDYLFLANGEHKNPDKRIVEAIIDSRLGKPELRSPNPRADKDFRLHFNSSVAATKGEDRKHMRTIEKLATSAAKKSGGRMTCSFLSRSSFQV